MKGNISIIENNIIATKTVRKDLCNALVENGYTVTVLTSGLIEDFKEVSETHLSLVDVGSSTQNPIDIIRYLWNLKKALQTAKPDVCLTFTIRPAIWGNIATRWLYATPTITNITGIGPLFEKNNFAYRGARLLYKFVLKKTSLVFFQNFDDMDIFLKNNFAEPKKVKRIPGSGVDYNFYAPLPNVTNKNVFSFLFISRLVKDKGICEYVQAAEIVKKKYPSIVFQVLGPLWSQNLKQNTITQDEIDDWVKQGVIEYLGEAKDVRPFIAASDCIVLPSYREGTSNVLLEAGSMEKPSITCNTTGCKEIIEDQTTGLLCEVKNAQDLALKMFEMYEMTPQQRKEMGSKARQKIIKEYDKSIVVTAYLDAIHSVALKK